jgi:hypothetical protein
LSQAKNSLYFLASHGRWIVLIGKRYTDSVRRSQSGAALVCTVQQADIQLTCRAGRSGWAHRWRLQLSPPEGSLHPHGSTPPHLRLPYCLPCLSNKNDEARQPLSQRVIRRWDSICCLCRLAPSIVSEERSCYVSGMYRQAVLE